MHVIIREFTGRPQVPAFDAAPSRPSNEPGGAPAKV